MKGVYMKKSYVIRAVVFLLCFSFLFNSCAGIDFSKLTVDELIKLLGDDSWEKRERASEELIKRGQKNILRFLEELKKNDDPEVRYRLGQILDRFGVILLGDRLIPVLTELAQWKKNFEKQADIIKKNTPDWRKTVQDDLQKKFNAIRTKYLTEENMRLQGFLGDILHEIGLIKDGLLPPPPGTTWTGQISQQDAITGLENLIQKLKNKIDEYGDMDKDGLPSSWELQNGLNAEKDDSKEDPDGDGINNSEEYKRGTDPQKKD